ncbi:phage major tail protein, TP901-1 family [Lysinibacillus sp. A4]|uniref:phage major tail protein, TP901-1 family n=1 Tax=unclassified Lysinibacillus TaxID=2636778 RepID=UPI001EDAB32A|nr:MULTISPECIES: phage major tail protein, TP901-1 family [unclassified Lysinibacillus]MCS5500874.1 phage major tail protein, TP901-1 family [Lysinibacillus sp. A4]UKJ44289.1 phage major tail protein, TP901-1 family [Lysinibacillus sp. ACHW1.5]
MQNGKDTVLLVQLADAALGSDGFLIGNLTENSYSLESELVDEQTKFGRILAYGQSSESFEISAYGDKKDPGQKAILDAIRNEKQLKVWEVDLKVNEDGTHDANFAYTLVESVEKSSPGDGFQEISATLQVIGKSQQGKLPKLPQEVIEFATYGFETPGEKSGEFGKDQTEGVVVDSVSVTPQTTSVVVGSTRQLTVTVLPVEATNKNVTFVSSDVAIATVTTAGLITGVAEGSATITITTASGGKTATVAVTVTAT